MKIYCICGNGGNLLTPAPYAKEAEVTSINGNILLLNESKMQLIKEGISSFKSTCSDFQHAIKQNETYQIYTCPVCARAIAIG